MRWLTSVIVTVTNGRIFDQPVYNYSRDFPLISEELRLPVTCTRDLVRAERILLDVAQAHRATNVSTMKRALGSYSSLMVTGTKGLRAREQQRLRRCK